MSVNASPPSTGSGRWVVALMVLAGIVAAAIAYGWWSGQQAGWRQEGVKPGDGAGSTKERSQAAKEIELVGDRFTAAIDSKQPLEPVRDAALRLTEKYPASADARKLLGQILLGMEDKPAAYEQLRLSLALDGRQAEVEVLAGTIQEELGDLDKAMVHYHSAVTLAPQNARYHTFMGNAYLLKGDRDKARMTLLEALAIDSSHHKAFALLAYMYAEEGKVPQALEQIQKAIDRMTLDERAVQAGYLRFKAMLLRRDNRPAESLQVLTEELLPQEQLDTVALTDIATTWGMLSEPARAAEAYENALQQDPTRWELLIDAARWRIRAKDILAAREHIAELRRLQPNHPALQDLFDALAKAGAAGEAPPTDDTTQWR